MDEFRVHRCTRSSYRVGILFAAVASRVRLESQKLHCHFNLSIRRSLSNFRKRLILVSINEVDIPLCESPSPISRSLIHKPYSSTDFVV